MVEILRSTQVSLMSQQIDALDIRLFIFLSVNNVFNFLISNLEVSFTWTFIDKISLRHLQKMKKYNYVETNSNTKSV